MATANLSREEILQFHPIYPHSGLLPLADNLWYVRGSIKRSAMPRNMVVFRRENGELVIHSGVALNPTTLAELESLGPVTTIIVPSPIHRMDARWYKAKYPKAKVLCPEAARAKVEATVEVDGTCEELLAKTGIKYHTMPGVKAVELAYEVPTENGAALLFCDALMNLDNLPGFQGKLMWLIGSTGFFGMTKIGKLFLLKDRATFRNWLIELAERKDLHSVIPSHGDPVRTDLPQKLRAAADRI